MKIYFLIIFLLICSIQQFYSQGDGVVSFAKPVRNSLKYNKFMINPTFSFVREQNRFISFNNKRTWVQFEDAPMTYLFSYSGRFKENSGIGLGFFQQNYGILSTFGGILNFAYNAVLDRDSNLTFGINLGFYKSGINSGKVITNFPDPSLENIPSNSLVTINPGINYGTGFFDFGISVNNLVLYNVKTSKIVEEDPEQSIQAHVLYTGYINSRGFFDESKFSGLIRSELKKDKTIFSGLMMLAIPKGIWGQAGFNSLYGFSAGVGINISSQISIEYNFEKSIGDLSPLGSSHDITLAYKLNNRSQFIYSGDDDDDAAIIFSGKKKIPVVAKRKTAPKSKTDKSTKAKTDTDARLAAEAKTKADEAKIKADAEKTEAKLAAVAKTKADEKAKLKLEAEAKIKTGAEAKADDEARLKLAAEAKFKADAEAKTKLEAESRAKVDEEAKLRLAAAAKFKADEEARLKLEAEAKIKTDAEAKAKLEAESRAKVDEEAKLRLAAAAKFKADEEARLKLEAEAKIKADAEAKAKLDAKPIDANTKLMDNIVKSTDNSKVKQEKLLARLGEAVTSKEKDLKDLKEENDLSEKGIFNEPKPFKSVTAENRALASLQLEIEDVIKARNEKIRELENFYQKGLKKVSNKEDFVNKQYRKAIETLKAEQLQAVNLKTSLISTLAEVKVATEIERKRRIKRAAYDNEEDRYLKDKRTLNQIKANTPLSTSPLKAEDFDFGEEQSNIQIIKGVKNVENGYYMVIAVHSDIAKRNDFLRKAVSLGQYNIDFFYDVNTSKYFIYHKKFNSIEDANLAMQLKVDKPYNDKMSMVKIEN